MLGAKPEPFQKSLSACRNILWKRTCAGSGLSLDSSSFCGSQIKKVMQARAAIYTRSSTSCRLSVDQQEVVARSAAKRLGATVIGVWREAPLSARQRRNGLPARSRMLVAVAGQVDQLIVADVTLLGRSLSDLVRVVGELERLGVRLLLAQNGDEPARRLDFRILDSSRARYQLEAAAEGRKRAVVQGTRMGRPTLEPERIAKARVALATGLGVRAAARIAGIGVASAFRVARAREATLRGDPDLAVDHT